MDLLARIMASGETPGYGPTADFWYTPLGSGATTAAGLRIDSEGAKKLSAWFRGRYILATSLAMLPLPLMQRLPDDAGATEARTHPLYDVLKRKPNPSQDAFSWRVQKMFHLVDYGNAYDWITPGARGFADALEPIDPTLVTPEKLTSGPFKNRRIYHVKDKHTGQSKTYTQDDIFHLMNASDDGVCGRGILQYARESLGTAVATERYAGKIYGQGTLNGGIIENPGILDKEAARRMAQSFVTRVGEWHFPKILEQGSKWIPNSLTPENAQMLLSRKFAINDIARWLGIPPHMLGDLERSTNNNIEEQGQEFVTYCLGPWLSLWEFAINDQLILQPNRFYVEFTRDALVRGDIAVRWLAHVNAVNAGIKTVDEVRAVEGMNKRGGKADELREPQNITGKPMAPAAGGDKAAPPSDGPSKAQAIAQASSARILRKEVAEVRKLAVRHATDGDAFAVAVADFYARHVRLVVAELVMPVVDAERYCAGQASQIVNGDWVSAVSLWESEHYAAGLAAMAIEEVA